MSIHNIQRLREAGFKIAIDDFGTGYANFERLKRLQADIIKIDGCFVRDILNDPQDVMIVKAICELAKGKSLTVVAEYVENEAQCALLLQAGVDYLQGYLLGNRNRWRRHKKTGVIPGFQYCWPSGNQITSAAIAAEHAHQRRAINQLQTKAGNHVALLFVQAFNRTGDDTDRREVREGDQNTERMPSARGERLAAIFCRSIIATNSLETSLVAMMLATCSAS